MQVNIRFLGATRNVTGSRFLLEANHNKILIDCGLYQERDFVERNWDPFPVAPSAIDAVLLTHAHLDHCGWLPKLVKEGFSGQVYCTSATAEIAKIVILDSAKIQVEDAEFKKQRHSRSGHTPPRPVEPLYTVEDAEACLPLFHSLPYEKPLLIGDNIEVSFHDAGHILGSSMIQVKVACDGQARTILFSGDVGRWDKPILQDPTIFEQADYVLVESTYGDRVHEPVSDIKENLTRIINQTSEAGGNIVIPSFSVERSQEVLYFLNELVREDKIPNLMAFLDSPMAVKVTEVFENHPEMFDEEMIDLIRRRESPFDFPGLIMSRTTQQSKAINHINGTVMIIAGSGMCTGGRVKHHLVNNISRPESTILFVGYQAVGTLGRSIVDGIKNVRILGEKRGVNAQIERIHGFSGHADQNELMRWLGGLKTAPRQVFVVHGETKSAEGFRKHLVEKTGWKVIIPSYQDSVRLD